MVKAARSCPYGIQRALLQLRQRRRDRASRRAMGVLEHPSGDYPRGNAFALVFKRAAVGGLFGPHLENTRFISYGVRMSPKSHVEIIYTCRPENIRPRVGISWFPPVLAARDPLGSNCCTGCGLYNHYKSIDYFAWRALQPSRWQMGLGLFLALCECRLFLHILKFQAA